MAMSWLRVKAAQRQRSSSNNQTLPQNHYDVLQTRDSVIVQITPLKLRELAKYQVTLQSHKSCKEITNDMSCLTVQYMHRFETMLQNNANWQTPKQPVQPVQQQQQQQQQPSQPPAPLYGNQVYQTAAPLATHWPEAQQQQHQTQQASLNYTNYYGSPQQHLQQSPQQQLLQQQQSPTTFYQPQAQQQQHTMAPLMNTTTAVTTPTAADLFDNNNGAMKNDGWGDWGDWNDNANNNNNIRIQHSNDVLQHRPLQQPAAEDAYITGVQAQSNWQAFANSNSIQEPAIASVAATAPHKEGQPPTQQIYTYATPAVDLPAPPMPIAESTPTHELESIVPPRAFQNQPTAAVPPLALPPSGAESAAADNPFKRGPAAKNQRVNILANATASAVAPVPTSLVMPLPLDSAIESLAGEVLAAPNDERAQYLQTSHLSEQTEALETNSWEADNLLPPPGLSRLVPLGEPELADQTQRLVTGTEEPLHLPERQADGEDTSEDERLLRTDNNSSVNQMANTNDRNLYFVAGESNVHVPQQLQQQAPLPTLSQHQRVVPGVETWPSVAIGVQQQQQTILPTTATALPATPSLVLSVEQREVVLDGENLEDQLEKSSSDKLANELPISTNAVTSLKLSKEEAKATQQLDEEQAEQQQQLQSHQQKSETLYSKQSNNSARESKSTQRKQLIGAGQHRHSQERQTIESDDDFGDDNSHYEFDDDSEYYDNSERKREHHQHKRERTNHSKRVVARERDLDQRDLQRRLERETWKHSERSERSERGERSTRGSYRGGAGQHSYEDGESGKPMRESKRRSGGGGASGNMYHYNRLLPFERLQQHSGGEEAYDRRTRYSNNSSNNYDGESDGEAVAGLGSGELSNGESNSRTRHQRRREHNNSDRRHRNYEEHDSSSRYRKYAREYEVYRRKSSRNSDLEKDRANNGGTGSNPGSATGSKRRSQYDRQQYGPTGVYNNYDMYEMSRKSRAYADMYSKFYGDMMSSVAAAWNAAAATKMNQSQTEGSQQQHSGVISAIDATKLLAANGNPTANALLRERERYTHAYITTQANEYHRHHYNELQQQLQLQQQQHQQHSLNYRDLLNSTIADDNGSLFKSSERQSRYRLSYGSGGLSGARSLSNLSNSINGSDVDYRGAGGSSAYLYAGSECGEIRAAATTFATAAQLTEAASGSAAVSTAAVQEPTEELEPRRRTPYLYSRPHLVGSYGLSLMLKVKPRYAGRGKLRNDVEVSAPRIRDATSNLLRTYPGPLQGRKLHKDKIINFCKEQIRLGPTRGCTILYATQKKPHGSVDKYRASHALMWHLLILLLKQNGVIADTDVGDLLLENQKEYPYNPSSNNLDDDTPAADGSSVQSEAEDGDTAEVTVNDDDTHSGAEDSGLNKATKASTPNAADNAFNQELTLEQATDKFRSYVLRGNVEEALQWAADNNLWTHAFFLALYEDRYALTEVAQKFLNRAVKANDPLQTLYQMKSCRMPICVTQLRDENWGDWRTHLAILVTNKSRQPESDRSSVVALGDTLFQRGDIYAAHFCYLVAQEEFGRYDSAATELSTLNANVPKLILLGASHYKVFNEFARNEAIIMTEIYEYARSLYDNKFSISNFQHYKYLLATRILDYGQHFRCSNYLEQIAKHIELKPESFSVDFMHRICSLAERLRYQDPILINRVSFATPLSAHNNQTNNSNLANSSPEEKAWLLHLRSLVDATPERQHQQQGQTIALQPEQPVGAPHSDINQQFVEVNKQFRELNMQYQETLQHQTPQDLTAQSLITPPEYDNRSLTESRDYNESAAVPTVDAYGQQQHEQAPQPMIPSQIMYHENNPHQQPFDIAQPSSAIYEGGHVDHAAQSSAEEQLHQPQQHSAGYDYWPMHVPSYGNILADEQQRPAISMPKSKSYDDDDNGNINANVASLGNNSGSQISKTATGKQQQQPVPVGAEHGGNQNTGWFGGLWSKLSLKPKNQMILPDDKNPTIVWDKERKCWTNTEANADEGESFKPPPKMSELSAQMPNVHSPNNNNSMYAGPSPTLPTQLPQSQQNPHELTGGHNTMEQPFGQQQVIANANVNVSNSLTTQGDAYGIPPIIANPAAATAAPSVTAQQPKLQSNIFKMQRNRTLKNSYVDVFNPSGAPMNAAPEQILAPIMAPAAVPQGHYFVPGAATGAPQQPQ